VPSVLVAMGISSFFFRNDSAQQYSTTVEAQQPLSTRASDRKERNHGCSWLLLHCIASLAV